VVFAIMLGLSDEELRSVKKEDVEEIVRHFESIIKEYAFAETYEKTERFCLAFALKCFRSTNLEKRYVAPPLPVPSTAGADVSTVCDNKGCTVCPTSKRPSP
jgi:hypothetical protein